MKIGKACEFAKVITNEDEFGNDKVVAMICLDSNYQIRAVEFRTRDEKLLTEIKRLVVFHVQHYRAQRGKMGMDISNIPISSKASDKLLSFEAMESPMAVMTKEDVDNFFYNMQLHKAFQVAYLS